MGILIFEPYFIQMTPTFSEFLDQELFSIGKYVLHTHNVASIIGVVAIAMLFAYVLKRLIYRSQRLDQAKKFAINKLSSYVIVVLAFLAGLHALGINISVILAGSAALLVGIGFGLQHLFHDFISGIILLMEGTLKVGDIIEVSGAIYKVQEINFRTTTVIGRDENEAILPNSELTASRIINWTHNDNSGRFKVSVGVDYATDASKMPEVMKKIAKNHPKVLKKPEPFVRFEEFADSSLSFSLYFFTDDIFRVEQTKSEMRFALFESLKQNGISIPFPQRVVHLPKNTSIE